MNQAETPLFLLFPALSSLDIYGETVSRFSAQKVRKRVWVTKRIPSLKMRIPGSETSLFSLLHDDFLILTF